MVDLQWMHEKGHVLLSPHSNPISVTYPSWGNDPIVTLQSTPHPVPITAESSHWLTMGLTTGCSLIMTHTS